MNSSTSEKSHPRNFQKLIQSLQGTRILVVGDVMLDEHIWSTVSRISPEAPVPIAQVQSITHVPGGAGNVAANISALGGKPILVGMVGQDGSASKLRSALRKNRIPSVGLIVSGGRVTTLKSRVIAHQQHVVRVDREDKSPIPHHVQTAAISKVRALIPSVSAVILSDYGKGFLTENVAQTIIQLARKKGKKVLVDPKVRNLRKYRGATLITPNQGEAALAANIEILNSRDCLRSGRILQKQSHAEGILITQGPDGMTYIPRTGRPLHVPAVERAVFDITGAGDSVIATLALALGSKIPIHEALMLATCAAGVAIGKVGTAPVSRKELLPFISEDHVMKQMDQWKIT